jgi:hypothetical protein
MRRLRPAIVVAAITATLAAGSIAAATLASADPGWHGVCRSSAPGPAGGDRSGGWWVTTGTLVQTRLDAAGDAGNCRYRGRKFQQAAGGSAVEVGDYYWWSHRICNAFEAGCPG